MTLKFKFKGFKTIKEAYFNLTYAHFFFKEKMNSKYKAILN